MVEMRWACVHPEWPLDPSPSRPYSHHHHTPQRTRPMFKWLFKNSKRAKNRGSLAKQEAKRLDFSTAPVSAGAASTSSPPHPTSTASSPGPSLESLIKQTGDVHTSVSSPEVNMVVTQYGTTHDLPASVDRSHLTSSITEDCPPSSSSTTTQPYQSPITSTGTSTPASVPTLLKDRSSSEPAIQFEGTNMTAGRDIGSKNILQQGDGNEVHVHYAGVTDEHEVLLRRIREKLGSYVASDATLSKDVHGDPSRCYQGTREGLLKHILSWVEGSPAETNQDADDVASRALCIVGTPGSGKSTIMNTLILDLLHDATEQSPGLIAAHYCIRRSLQSTTDSTKVLPTLILQLARRDLSIAKHISVLLSKALLTEVFTPQLQEEIFLQAISSYKQVVFVIIDALDEASKPTSLAATLSRVIPISPPNIRLLLATRNKHGVLQRLGTALISRIVHQIPTEDSVDEVSNYITCRLRDGLGELFGNDPSWCFWPDNSQLHILSDKAGGLYIWARTAVDFILSRLEKRGEIGRDRLIEDVGRIGMADVNTLYMFILKRSLQDDVDDKDGTALQRIREVLGFITVAKDPLPLDDIVGFLGFKDFDVRHFVRLTRSILVAGIESIAGSTILQFHKTFSDFLTSDRAEEFQIEIEHAHHLATSRCFELMVTQLRFNICGLRSSFSPTERLDKLAASVPKGLIYASTSWSYHLTLTLKNSGSQLLYRSYIAFIKTLLFEKFLFWLEIVSLAQKTHAAGDWMKELAHQLESNKLLADVNEVDLSIYAKDAHFWIQRFSECIGDSIPHIYISFLAFSDRDSAVANHYRKRSVTTVIPHPSGIPPRWYSWDVHPGIADVSLVRSVSFSPCGRRLAAAYDSDGVWVWDVETGKCGTGRFMGHRGAVQSVCFSPNRLLIASGYDDKTIYVWDAETGKDMLGPLTGHTGSVSSVSFSPNSTGIASGSADGTVRVWDARNGDCVLGPLEGDGSDINSVSYSPDGSCIASGSKDASIWLWNAQTGRCICRPLAGHENWISSVSFNPTGRWLASSSWDDTLRIWDIEKGTCTHGPLTGHDDTVLSVCFSPDGLYMASGSGDRTVCIWDAETAACVAGPIRGASDGVKSVTFSPDGRLLAAGSWDGTVRLWDFNALLSARMCGLVRGDEALPTMEITDYTAVKKWIEGRWTLGPKGERLFWAPYPFHSAIWRPSTVRIFGRPCMIKPDLSSLVTGEEWLKCFPSS